MEHVCLLSITIYLLPFIFFRYSLFSHRLSVHNKTKRQALKADVNAPLRGIKEYRKNIEIHNEYLDIVDTLLVNRLRRRYCQIKLQKKALWKFSI